MHINMYRYHISHVQCFFVLFTVPALRGPLVPRTTSEIIWSAKETCGSIFYIKREIYLVTMVIELLKLSAIAFKLASVFNHYI